MDRLSILKFWTLGTEFDRLWWRILSSGEKPVSLQQVYMGFQLQVSHFEGSLCRIVWQSEPLFLLLLLLPLWGVCVCVCVCLCFNQGRGYQGKHITQICIFQVLLIGFLSDPFNSALQIVPAMIRYPTFSCFQYKHLSGCGVLKSPSFVALFEIPLV